MPTDGTEGDAQAATETEKVSPIGCNCGGSAQKLVNYQVRFKDGTEQVFTTAQEAQIAIRDARGGTMKPIPAK